MKKYLPVYFLAAALLLMPAVSSHAQDNDGPEADADERPTVVDKGIVKEILDSDMIELGNDRRYKLDNVLVPPYEDQPAVEELNRLLLGKQVSILIYSSPDDKPQHGLPAVQVITDKNAWVQEDLVAKGLAWAYISDTNEQMIYPLKVVEDNARIQKVGFWKNPVYAIKTPDNVKNFMNSYQVVEGKILSTNVRPSGTTFLNFGKNWKTDFEVRVRGNNDFLGLVNDPRAPKPKKALTREEAEVQNRGFNPQQWEGRIVRVRGWVHGVDGPIIDLAHREQIDFIDGQATGK